MASNYIKGEFPEARTNIIDVEVSSLPEIANRLSHLRDHGKCIGRIKRNFDYDAKGDQDIAQLIRNQHSVIETIIANECGMSEDERNESDKFIYFSYIYRDPDYDKRFILNAIYVANSEYVSTSHLYSPDGLSDEHLRKDIEALITIQIRLSMMEELSEFSDISFASYNSEILLSLDLKKYKPQEGGDIIEKKFSDVFICDCFRFNVYFSEFNELITTIRAKSLLLSELKSKDAISKIGSIATFRERKNKRYQFIENSEAPIKVDARKSKKKFFQFSSQKAEDKTKKAPYLKTKNFSQNYIQDKVDFILERFDIKYKARRFRADLAYSNFLSIEQLLQNNEEIINFTRPLMVIDTRKDMSRGVMVYDSFKRLLSKMVENIVWVHESEISIESVLDKDFNILVINSKDKVFFKSSISIFSEDENVQKIIKKNRVDTFDKAYQLIKNLKNDGIEVEADFYTNLKIKIYERYNEYVESHVDDDLGFIDPCPFSDLNIPVIQGFDMYFPNELDESNSNKTEESKSVPENPTKKEKGEQSKILKTLLELYLKEKVFNEGKVPFPMECDNQYEIAFIRSSKADGKARANIYVAQITICDFKITIDGFKIYEYEKNKSLPSFLSCLGDKKLYNDSFYICEKTSGNILMSYNSGRVPVIIGNPEFDMVEMAIKEPYSIRRARDKGKGYILPYYLDQSLRKIGVKTHERVYIESYEEYAYIFVRSHKEPETNISKQNLIYNIQVYDKYGNLLKPTSTDIMEFYLGSFTYGIQNINEISKTSILEKIIRLFVYN
jgi:hypothetical protein